MTERYVSQSEASAGIYLKRASSKTPHCTVICNALNV